MTDPDFNEDVLSEELPILGTSDQDGDEEIFTGAIPIPIGLISMTDLQAKFTSTIAQPTPGTPDFTVPATSTQFTLITLPPATLPTSPYTFSVLIGGGVQATATCGNGYQSIVFTASQGATTITASLQQGSRIWQGFFLLQVGRAHPECSQEGDEDNVENASS